MKTAFKNIIIKLLWFQVGRLRKKYQPITIAVVGSIGKTGTKTAIATVLSEHLRVQWQNGNYNSEVSVPLVFFGQKMPKLYSLFGWLKVFIVAELYIQTGYKYQAVVLELAVDHPGDMEYFKEHLRVDYGVLTAITPEHMENFKNLDEVAHEELLITEIADVVVVSSEAVDAKYRHKINDSLTYGYESTDDCCINVEPLLDAKGRNFSLTYNKNDVFQFRTPLIGKQGLPALACATLIARALELTQSEIENGIQKCTPLPGRMNVLEGYKGAVLIDDTYNASPEATTAALDTLYELPSKDKIAILGQMNELGEHSKKFHQQVGTYCSPKQLSLVVTIGDDANNYLAVAAEKNGCRVVRCPTPYHAADVVLPLMHKGTTVLAKGSQNAVYAEESVKLLLKNTQDVKKLVRQSPIWIKKKDQDFRNS